MVFVVSSLQCCLLTKASSALCRATTWTLGSSSCFCLDEDMRGQEGGNLRAGPRTSSVEMLYKNPMSTACRTDTSFAWSLVLPDHIAALPLRHCYILLNTTPNSLHATPYTSNHAHRHRCSHRPPLPPSLTHSRRRSRSIFRLRQQCPQSRRRPLFHWNRPIRLDDAEQRGSGLYPGRGSERAVYLVRRPYRPHAALSIEAVFSLDDVSTYTLSEYRC